LNSGNKLTLKDYLAFIIALLTTDLLPLIIITIIIIIIVSIISITMG